MLKDLDQKNDVESKQLRYASFKEDRIIRRKRERIEFSEKEDALEKDDIFASVRSNKRQAVLKLEAESDLQILALKHKTCELEYQRQKVESEIRFLEEVKKIEKKLIWTQSVIDELE